MENLNCQAGSPRANPNDPPHDGRPWHLLAPAAVLLAVAASALPAVAFTDGLAMTGTPAALNSMVTSLAAAQAGMSGFSLLVDDGHAFTLRHELALAADRSIDAQYYIWENDDTGRLLARDLLEAAGRGVRVRVLLDDIHTGGQDFTIAALDEHPNIEIRLFNPFDNRVFRNLNLVTDLSRLNHRMHNKALIVDGVAAIVGGRNIGDDYFGLSSVANFRDLDAVAMGPVVAEIASSFEAYWNSPQAKPVGAVASDLPSPEEASRLRDSLAAWAQSLQDFPYALSDSREASLRSLGRTARALAWAPATVAWDQPDKRGNDHGGGVLPAVRRALERAEREVLIEAAYFVPGDAYTRLLTSLAGRGIHVRSLTNSAATNDLVPAHAGYTRYRERLLRGGVELYEFRPDATGPRRGWPARAGSSRASLHSKVTVIDARTVIIGSFNPTPRSVEMNTEIGVIIESPSLAAQVREFMDVGVAAANAWQLACDDRGRLSWAGSRDGAMVELRREPDVGLWRRLVTTVIAWLPVETSL
jgi:putative cardiolipin synthase